MSEDEACGLVRDGEITRAVTPIQNEPKVDLARRRALAQAGWAVPAILAIGLPREAKAQNGSPPIGEEPVPIPLGPPEPQEPVPIPLGPERPPRLPGQGPDVLV